MTREELIERGKAARVRRAWAAAFRDLSAADAVAPLTPTDLEVLAETAHLLGRYEDFAVLLTRAHRGYLAADDAVGAARCAFWIAFGALTTGDGAQSAGWLARARRLLDDGGHDCVERAWLLVPAGIRAFRAGDLAASQAAFGEVAAAGQRFRDADLVALGLLGQGRNRLCRGEMASGRALLDEAMIAVQAEEVSPRTVGGIYCTALEICGEIFDLRRAQAWTAALDRWCQAQPDLVPFRGACMVRRAEHLKLHGAWPEALAEAERARESLSAPGPETATALHVVGDIRRLRGELALAEEACREAARWERTPDAGFALLRLAQGQPTAAHAAIRHVLDAARDDGGRARALEAGVEIALAAGDTAAARGASEALSALAARLEAPVLAAAAGRAAGAVRLAEGDARGALSPLREALTTWRELDAPHEAARAQVLIAQACLAGGDQDAAERELSGARVVFERLGAAPELARVEALGRRHHPAGKLTAREVQVLALVASGRTNRAIAGELGLSEKTVARHLSNIFAKLDLPSRAAATAYAYEHALV